jgi:tRNA A37 threonylcarbamoyladenosine dehydratase
MEKQEFNSDDYNLRFGGIARLYGISGLKKLLQAHVMVIGVGGVGSWAAEALARSGVGAITLVDLDDICITNTNRQLPAMDGQFGKLKIEVIKDRILSINPQCKVTAHADFFTEKTADALLDNRCDFVLEAIDSLNNKCLLIAKCRERKIPIMVVGGAAGKRDPSQVKIVDLGETTKDALLFKLRKKLRQDFAFPGSGETSFKKRPKFKIPCVFSAEDPVFPSADGEICAIPDPATNLKLDCESGMGSITHVTATYGMLAAGHVINTLASS